MARTKSIAKTVEQLVSSLGGRGIAVEVVVLFGSQRNGKATRHSDIDLAVISSAFDRINLFKRQALLGEIKWEIHRPIDPLGYTLKEYQHTEPGTFLHEIKRTGKVVYRRR